jgi:hypothetical protein
MPSETHSEKKALSDHSIEFDVAEPSPKSDSIEMPSDEEPEGEIFDYESFI